MGVGLYMYVVVVQKFTFAISSPDEFLLQLCKRCTSYSIALCLSVCLSFCPSVCLLGCPKLTKRSQPLVGRSSPYCGDSWRTHCCLTSFSDCRYVPWFRRYSRQSCAMVPRWRFLATFLRPGFQRAACSTAQT